MIILDTNVISETQKPEPDPLVMDFLDSLDPTTTYLTSITVAEMLYGIDIMPSGKRKQELENSAFQIIQVLFKDRILPFDESAASHGAILAADAKRDGNKVRFADGQIAGIARANMTAKVATRDVRPFQAMGVNVINPWKPIEPEKWILESD